jgi:hypothetical protein
VPRGEKPDGLAGEAHAKIDMRWAIEFRDEYFGTLQGVQMIGFS